MKNLVKIDRFFAWILFISMILFFISGYGMTKGIIDTKFSVTLHNDILPVIILISFVIHSAYATRLAFIRWKAWNLFIKIIWFLVFTGILISFIYIDFFYSKDNNQTSSKLQNTPTTTISPSATTRPTQSTQTTNDSDVKVFTLEELSQYNGQNGNPAYVAVDNIVYDMSDVFNNGTHYKHIAGQELTDEFYSTHIESEITKYPQVGIIKQ